MGWTVLFEQQNTVAFLLLFIRFGSLFAAVPIFSHQNIPIKVKATLALFFAIVFFDAMPPIAFEPSLTTLVVAVLGEMLFGLAVGVMLQLAFNVITFAGGQISFVMGFSMASVVDPQSGISMPIISQFLSLIALMVLFALDMHHWIILFVDESLAKIPLGGFLLQGSLMQYVIDSSARMFAVGFMIAFPIIALSWLSDVIFGMLMKTMPQFNLLVIGFPIKIAISMAVLIATLTSAIYILKNEMIRSFNLLQILF